MSDKLRCINDFIQHIKLRPIGWVGGWAGGRAGRVGGWVGGWVGCVDRVGWGGWVGVGKWVGWGGVAVGWGGCVGGWVGGRMGGRAGWRVSCEGGLIGDRLLRLGRQARVMRDGLAGRSVD